MRKAANQKTPTAKKNIENLLTRAHQQWEKGELRSAFYLFLNAAKLGDVTAQLDLGYFYDTGIGVKPNRSAALQWYKRAYRQGHGSAANNIGTIFRDEGDLQRAITWFERAVNLGDLDANLEIAKVLLMEKKQIPEARSYLNRVLAAQSKVEVTMASQKEAVHLFKFMEDKSSS